jgi:hypothetical protein
MTQQNWNVGSFMIVTILSLSLFVFSQLFLSYKFHFKDLTYQLFSKHYFLVAHQFCSSTQNYNFSLLPLALKLISLFMCKALKINQGIKTVQLSACKRSTYVMHNKQIQWALRVFKSFQSITKIQGCLARIFKLLEVLSSGILGN